MKRTIKSVFAIVLAVLLVISSFSVLAIAKNDCEKSGMRLTYIQSYRGSINKGLLSTTVSAEISGKSNVTKVKIKMELQKLTSGNYSTIETWEQTFNSNEGSMSESRTTNPLSTYRLKATVTAYSGSNSESQTFYEY
ncbi:MAG: hypothetical protein IK085_10075 [Clostridia bacterium]|nr:hypothetical protein [Clostridia bacterium]